MDEFVVFGALVETLDIAELAEWVLSPEYVALTIISLRGFAGEVYVVTHDGTGRAHEEGTKVPPLWLSLKVIVPERAVGELDVSVVRTEKVRVLLEGRLVEEGAIVVLVGLR